MGHLVEAFKKLDQQREVVRSKPARRTTAAPRAAMRPKPFRPTPAVGHAAKVWRIDEPHRIAVAQHSSELDRSDTVDRAVATGQRVEIQAADETQPTPHITSTIAVAPRANSATGAPVQSADDACWRFPAPMAAGQYDELAAFLVAQARGLPRPHTVLLTTVSNPAHGAVSFADLALVLSEKGNVLWIDTQNMRPAPAATRLAQGKKSGWHDLLARQANWEELVAPTSLPGVSFVGCGQRMVDVYGQGIDEHLFDPLRSAFSFVLIDGGSVETSAPLAPACSLIGLAVVIGHARRSQVDRALQALSAAGGRSPVVIALKPGNAP